MEFEEARKELQHELGKGSSLAELRQKLLKGNIETKVNKQPKNKKYFTTDRIQRKKRDIMELLNKYILEDTEEKVSHVPKPLTAMEIYSKVIEEQNASTVLNKKLFKLGQKELLVR